MKKYIAILAALLIAGLVIVAKNCRNPSSNWEVCERYADNDQQRLRCAIYFKPELIDSTFYPKTNAIN